MGAAQGIDRAIALRLAVNSLKLGSTALCPLARICDSRAVWSLTKASGTPYIHTFASAAFEVPSRHRWVLSFLLALSLAAQFTVLAGIDPEVFFASQGQIAAELSFITGQSVSRYSISVGCDLHSQILWQPDKINFSQHKYDHLYPEPKPILT
ncbi:hypothetical protein B0H10DRAFT_1959186 [Mycena sp. CBHHK59/15]|nr:hypothetical protein B0H10DRAFT_1959186 [Mycena sp. CBHHK59/15]